MKIFVGCIVIGLILVLFFSIKLELDYRGKQNKAIKAIDRFHSQFNARTFREIYIKSSPEFQASFSENKFIETLSYWRQKFGEIKSEHQEISQDLISFDTKNKSVRIIVSHYKEEVGNLNEEFTWDISEKEAKLVRYKIYQVFFKPQ